MDLPSEDRQQLLRWNLDTIGGSDFTSRDALAADGQMEGPWRPLVRSRQDGRTDERVSPIRTAVAEEWADLPDDEVWGSCSLLHDASQNTTINVIPPAAIVMARHPAHRRLRFEQPERWAAAEELLGSVSPGQGLARATPGDLQVAAVPTPDGDPVLLLYGSANHDESLSHDPETLDLGRQPRAQWIFGHGIHYCLGAAVAKVEPPVARRCLTEARGDWELAETGLVRHQPVPNRGWPTPPSRSPPWRDDRDRRR
jgi:cytochrome P450